MEKCFSYNHSFSQFHLHSKVQFRIRYKFHTALSKSGLTRSFPHNQNILDRNQIPLTNTVPHDYKHPDTRTPSARHPSGCLSHPTGSHNKNQAVQAANSADFPFHMDSCTQAGREFFFFFLRENKITNTKLIRTKTPNKKYIV